MTDLHALDRFAYAITDFIKTDGEDSTYHGAELNDKYAVLSDFIARMNDRLLEESPEKARFLFEDISIDALVVNFTERWAGSLTDSDWMKNQPLLCDFQRSKEFRSGPELQKIADKIGNFPVVLATRKASFKRASGDCVTVLLRPKFPEWYVYYKDSKIMSIDSRHKILKAMLDIINKIFKSQERIKQDDIDGMYFFFIKDTLPKFIELSEQSSVAKSMVKTVASLYSLLQVEASGDSIFEIPSFFKEYIMLLFQDNYKHDFLGYLREQLAEARSS